MCSTTSATRATGLRTAPAGPGEQPLQEPRQTEAKDAVDFTAFRQAHQVNTQGLRNLKDSPGGDGGLSSTMSTAFALPRPFEVNDASECRFV